MVIRREDLERIDFSDVASGRVTAGRRLKPLHPGRFLEEEFIKPLGLTHYRVAKGAGMQQRRLDEICMGKRAVTADAALRLGRFFGFTPQWLMNLQAAYDLEVAKKELGKRLKEEVTPLEPAL